MKRVSVTTLETYRKFLAGDGRTTQESLIQSIITPFEGNEYTSIGSAFHAIVELGEQAVEELPEMGKFRVTAGGRPVIFNEEQVAMALKYRAKLPHAFHEEWIGREFRTPAMPIWVHGRVDVLHGIFIRDIKTKYSAVRYDDYANSAQWRLYLDLTGLDTFYFDVFEFPGYRKDVHGCDVSALGIRPYGAIEQIRYGGMEDDDRRLVRDFTDFIVRHDLTRYLKDRDGDT